VNTFVLLACLTLTAHFATADVRPTLAVQRAWPFALGALALLLVGTSGAIAALGDTLYPATSVLGGIHDELSPAASLLVRLRLSHPVLALAGAAAAAYAALPALRGPGDTPAGRAARALAGLMLVQLVAGLVNVALLAPIWLQIVHLLLADLAWIAFVLLAARYLTTEISLSRTGSRE
jgi:heme A synthase